MFLLIVNPDALVVPPFWNATGTPKISPSVTLLKNSTVPDNLLRNRPKSTPISKFFAVSQVNSGFGMFDWVNPAVPALFLPKVYNEW